MPMQRVTPGKPKPLGATITENGVQFALFSRDATAVHLALFQNSSDTRPYDEITLDPQRNRSGDIWHVNVEGLSAGTLYLFRVDGPWEPEEGLRFNANKFLLDPYAKALTADHRWDFSHSLGYDVNADDGDLSFSETANGEYVPKCIVIDDSFDWEGDQPLNYPLRFSVIYETHVRGLTRHPSSGVEHPGTYRGVTEKIGYFKDLGITSLELLPIHEFDEHELHRTHPQTGAELTNYWGYSSIAFFAPKARYAADPVAGGQVREFKQMVKELHAAGIEVILDVVFNHTGEGNEYGPTISFRGIDNRVYYMLDERRRYYKNYSGCGNTLNCNHPIVRTLIRDCLHYWVVEMHIDGFRFDLGSILGRDQKGNLMENPPMLEGIAEDPILRNTKIIAEAWDAGGAYQVGWFPGGRWAEWNDRFRDDVRRFGRGDKGVVADFATRISGSSDLYLRDGRKPFHSINFVTSHDGFTLRDLVSYARKHNEDNGENNRDGHNSEYSHNYGVEGDTTNRSVLRVRRRQIKNFIASLLLSLGTPMLLGGDEFGRTQRGNNNAYCQDNEISWYDWGLLRKYDDIQRFTRMLIRFRLAHPAFLRPEFFTGKDYSYNAIPDISWSDEIGKPMDWSSPRNLLAVRIDGSKAEIRADRDDNDFYIMFNSTTRERNFTVCDPTAGRRWYRAVDTALDPPQDIVEPGAEAPLSDPSCYVVRARSIVVLLAR